MTWLLAMAGWLVAAAVIAVVLGRAIRDADVEVERQHQARLDKVEQRRRERLRRAMGDER